MTLDVAMAMGNGISVARSPKKNPRLHCMICTHTHWWWFGGVLMACVAHPSVLLVGGYLPA
jgi:hypothetical protein